MPGEFYVEGKAEKVSLLGVESSLAGLHGKADGIKAQTDGIPAVDASVAGLHTKADGIKAQTDEIPNLALALAGLQTTADAVQAQTDKLAGAAPGVGSTMADWQTAEADVISIGAANVRNKIHDLTLSIHNLAGTQLTVRLYKLVNGVERKVYQQAFDAATDPPGLPVINGAWALHGVLRVTLQSNDLADNGKAVDYDCMLEAM